MIKNHSTNLSSIMILVAILAVAISVVGTVLHIVGSIRIIDDTYYFSKRTNKYSWKVGQSPDIEVNLDEGTIVVAQSTDSRVSAILVSSAETKLSQETANAALDDLAISATHEGDAIRLKTTRTLKAGVRDLKADLELRVPSGANLNLLTGHGAIFIGKYWGGPDGTDLINSPVVLNSVKARDMGKFNVGIEADIAPNPSLYTTRLELKSKNGSILIKGTNVLIDARAEVGGIEYAGRPAPGIHKFITKSYSYHSDETWRIRDGIKITLPADSAFELDATSSNGNVTSDFFKETSAPSVRHIFKDTFGIDPHIKLELRSDDSLIAVHKNYH